MILDFLAYGWRHQILTIAFYLSILILIFLLPVLKGFGINNDYVSIAFYVFVFTVSIYFGFILRKFPEIGGIVGKHKASYLSGRWSKKQTTARTSYKGKWAMFICLILICISTFVFFDFLL